MMENLNKFTDPISAGTKITPSLHHLCLYESHFLSLLFKCHKKSYFHSVVKLPLCSTFICVRHFGFKCGSTNSPHWRCTFPIYSFYLFINLFAEVFKVQSDFFTLFTQSDVFWPTLLVKGGELTLVLHFPQMSQVPEDSL